MLIGCCGTTDTYDLISHMGYDYIELSSRQIMSLSDKTFDAYVQHYKTCTFPCLAFNDYCDKATPITGPGYQRDITYAYANKLCQRGAALGVKTIGIGAPSARMLPTYYSCEKADSELMDFLHTLCGVAQPYGITILLEAVHQYMCNYLNYTSHAQKIVQMLNIPNLGIVFDLYHAKIMKENRNDMIAALPYIKHLHISTDLQNHARGFLTEEDIPELFDLIKTATDAGYIGNISVEAAERFLGQGGFCANYMWHAVAMAISK